MHLTYKCKKTKLLIAFLVFNLTVVSYISAQNIDFHRRNFPDRRKEFRKALDNLREGDYYFSDTEYRQALKYYMIAYEFNPDYARLNLQIGLCYLNLYPRSEAIRYIERARNLSPEDHKLVLHLAEVYRLNYEFDKAIELYNNYKSTLSSQIMEREQQEINRIIEQCIFAAESVKKPVMVLIENLGTSINSPFPEYSPIITADESVLIFTSRRPNTTGGRRDPDNPGYYEDIYISYNIDGKWTKAHNPEPPLNSRYHDAVVGLSNDGQRLITYKGRRGGGIYEARLEGSRWGKPLRFPRPLNSRYHEPSASFSFDERTIYFVSNRPGGYGGSDIYMSRYDENTGWSEPKNLGNTINTEHDEDAVFMHPDGKTLYFSSKGHPGMGGYDIFRSVYENDQWSKPENLGYPINTPDDDVFFSITADNRYAYFSSTREQGLGGQDIYRAIFQGYEKRLIFDTEDQLIAIHAETVSETNLESEMALTSSMMILLKGIVRDETTNRPILAQIEMVDNQRNEVIATFNSNSQTGRFLISLPAGKNYGITLRADGYLFHSENFNIPDLREFKVVEKDISLKKVEVGKEITLNNVFFDYKEYRLRNESISELERVHSLLKEYPGLVIEISGHTDNIGHAEYNKELSLKRAKSVVDYLIAKGIDESRLQYVGYGFEKPIAPNDTEEGRKLNRRSEFRVIQR